MAEGDDNSHEYEEPMVDIDEPRYLSGSKTATLDDLPKFRFELENGEKRSFRISQVVKLPRKVEGEELADAAADATEEAAWWAHQTARYAAKLARQEIATDAFIAEVSTVIRDKIDDGDTRSSKEFGVMRDAVNGNASVIAVRQELADLRETFDIIRTIRDAVQNKAALLRKQIGA